MSLIGILFGVVFVTLLIKAICETIWGCILILHGLLCHGLAAILNLIASTIRLGNRITTKSKKNAEPHRMTISEAIIMVNCPNSREAKRIRAAFRLPA